MSKTYKVIFQPLTVYDTVQIIKVSTENPELIDVEAIASERVDDSLYDIDNWAILDDKNKTVRDAVSEY